MSSIGREVLASQAKKNIHLPGAFAFHGSFALRTADWPMNVALYAVLAEYCSEADHFQTYWSWTPVCTLQGHLLQPSSQLQVLDE